MNLFPSQWIDRVIGINTETRRSNAKLVAFLRPLLENSGLKVLEHRVKENGQTFVNLIAHNGHLGHPDLLVLNTHLDTVSAGDPKRWTKTAGNPLKATRVRDRIYGLGTADVKLDFLCKLWAMRQAQPLNRPVALVGTYGEERGLIGARKLFEDKKVKPRYAMVGEPSNLELIYAHKGHLIATASLALENAAAVQTKSWTGKAAHSSTPHLGVNALGKAFAHIRKKKWGIVSLRGGTDSNRVPEHASAQVSASASPATHEILKFIDSVEGLARRYRTKRDPRFSPSFTTLSWNLSEVVEGRLELTFDFRILPGVDSNALRADLCGLIPSSGRWGPITIDLPLTGSKDSTLMKAASSALKACGVPPMKKTKASSTEAAIYCHEGAEAVVFGPGISVGNVHKPNEYNLLSQIRVATRFYHTLVLQPWEGN